MEEPSNQPDSDEQLYDNEPHTPSFGVGHKKRRRWLLWVVLAVVVLAAIGAAVYLFFIKENVAPTNKTPSQTTKQQSNSGTTDLNEPQSDATEKSYKSDKLGIGFTYRSDWTVKESGDQITLTSPRVAYTTADDQATEGVFTVKLRHGVVPEAMVSAVQESTTVRESLVIAYAHPTTEQRQYTNLTYAGPTPQRFGFFIVSGSIAYKPGTQLGSQIDLLGKAYLFVGGYGADSSDSLTFDAVPAASFDAADAYKQAQQIIESIKIY